MLTLYHGDCREVMKTLPDASVDAIVTDPPYELGFMGKGWDSSGVANDVKVWRQALRVLKPGGYLLAFSGTRTYHRMVCAIEDAGFEIRDQIGWAYGSGFPKSMDVSKAIDKAAGAERERYERAAFGGTFSDDNGTTYGTVLSREPATEAARQWQGWGTALKPAWEPIVMARKPLIGTVAENVLKHGTGALNIDGCRVPTNGEVIAAGLSDPTKRGRGAGEYCVSTRDVEKFQQAQRESLERANTMGRWPANLIHDGSDEVLAAFPQAPGQLAKAAEGDDRRKNQNTYGAMSRGSNGAEPREDTGSAARFFYCAKASKRDRGDGNTHPTVKPTDLMRYLCRLVTPPGGIVLDPFLGSGSTGKAALLEGFGFIGVELTAEYIPIARARIEQAAFGDLA